MTFSMSLLRVLRKTIRQNALGVSYEDLLGFGIIINIDFLKWEDQCPKFIQALAILIIDIKHMLLSMIHLRSFHKILSMLEADESLHFMIADLNSSFKK